MENNCLYCKDLLFKAFRQGDLIFRDRPVDLKYERGRYFYLCPHCQHRNYVFFTGDQNGKQIHLAQP